jgi:hypothetical protein
VEFILASAATKYTIGLLIAFGGIGVLANVIIVYIAAIVMGERAQNREYAASGRGGDD